LTISTIEIAVIVEVAEGASAARVRASTPTGGLDQFFKFSISQIAKNHRGVLIRVAG